jgi:catechol-2,3-dioxygenase
MSKEPDRRAFLKATGAAALLAAMHEPSVWAGESGVAASVVTSTPAHLIKEIRLQTAVPLSRMRQFYCERLGFKALADSADELTIAGGGTRISFVPAKPGVESPFYHFAFNIPQNKLREARQWQLRRTAIIPPEANNVDPAYGKDVWDFRHWNAHSIFFWDPADNIVEYIARHELKNDGKGEFTVDDIHFVSEIGLMVDDQQAAAAEIGKHLGLSEYPRGARPWAMGDAHGLLLCLQRGRIWGPHERKRTFAEYPTEVTIRGPRSLEFNLKGQPYRIVAS